VWNRIGEDIQDQIVELALEETALSPRELAMRLEWAAQRGSRSGRTARQFIQSLPVKPLNLEMSS
jgi:predicted AAA+ superfamily ATPase